MPPSGLGSSQDGSAGAQGLTCRREQPTPRLYPVLEALCMHALCSAPVDGSLARPSQACAASGDRPAQGLGLGPNSSLPGLCTLWGGPGRPRRRRTISPDSQLGSRAAPLSDQWRSSHSPGTRQTRALAQTRTNPQCVLGIPVSVDHPPKVHTALPAKTPCLFSFKHQGRSSKHR